MEEIELGTKIRILPDVEQEPFMLTGDIAAICEPPHRWSPSGESDMIDKDGMYWADFNNCGNASVYGDGIWCVGIPGRHFEILEEKL